MLIVGIRKMPLPQSPLLFLLPALLLLAALIACILLRHQYQRQAARLAAVVKDLEKTKKSEENVKARLADEQRWAELLLNRTRYMVFVHPLTEDGLPDTFSDVNDVACMTLGYTRERLMDTNILDLERPAAREVHPAGSRSRADAVNAFERHMIARALGDANGIQTRAAEALGTTRRILKYRMEKLKVQFPKEEASTVS